MNDHHPHEPRSVPLAALEHFHYCARQAGLIHLDQVWSENIATVAGDLAHQNVDLPGARTRRGTKAVRALPVHSHTWHIHGICDLVEITGDTAVPVEYKVGRYRPGGSADIQVAGQALCLREAGFTVTEAFVYSAAERRRHPVALSDALIATTIATIEATHQMMRQHRLPEAVADKRCRGCSLREDCLPELSSRRHLDADGYLYTARDEGSWDD
jgi:CRISPR-associated exonuclease Cas4